MRESLLQDYVVPICSAEISGGAAHLRRLLGTAFFINGTGVFLTARHVVQQFHQEQQAQSLGTVCGLCIKSQDVGVANQFAFLQGWERAPEPYDIAVGRVNAKSRSWFSPPEGIRSAEWQDVASWGYPQTALNTAADNFNIHERMLKGYVQRFVNAGEIELIAPHPDCYELSFAITSGVSGAPLFIVKSDRQELLGVCVGSYSAEVTEYRSTVVEDNGRRLEERSVRVEEIGIAESLFPLLSWTPKLLGERPLAALISPSE